MPVDDCPGDEDGHAGGGAQENQQAHLDVDMMTMAIGLVALSVWIDSDSSYRLHKQMLYDF